MRSIVAIVAIAAGLAGLALPAAAAAPIGKVTRMQGASEGAVAGFTGALAVNDPVYLDEAVTTGAGARLELTLDDQTTLTLGEKASVRLDDFVYRPDQSVVKVTMAGAFRFVSGKIGASVPRDASITTPFALIAVRGTDLWGGPIDGALGVVLFEGAVDVSNAGVVAKLTAPGQGVNLATPAAPPGAVTPWAQDKIGRAVATVAFQ
jgi:hypothetical protein